MSTSILFKRGNQDFGNNPRMTDPKIIGANVKRLREAAGLSQADLAKEIGARSQNTVADIELGHTRRSSFLYKISQRLKVAMTDIDPDSDVKETVMVPLPQSATAADLGLYASVEAGDGVVVITNDPIQMIPRPSVLANVRDAYAVIVVGDSMTPVVRAGHTVFINPHLPPQRAIFVCSLSSGMGNSRPL